MAPLNRALLEWERVYEALQPHYSQDDRTPAKYLRQCYPSLDPSSLSHMYRTNTHSSLQDVGAVDSMYILTGSPGAGAQQTLR